MALDLGKPARGRPGVGLLLALLAAFACAGAAAAADRGQRLILVTVDGLDWTEVFRGADPARVKDPAFTHEPALVRKDFVDRADRPRALMPFLHDVVAREGVLLGDRDHGSCVAVANRQWFSYPGYNEVLTGRPDPAIVSNAHGPNANVTFLEWLNRRPGFAGQVRAVTSWDAFADILNTSRSGILLNAGWANAGRDSKVDGPVPPDRARLQRDAPHLWPAARLDAFTHAWAMDTLVKKKPRVLYVAYNDTDDFAHEGRYDQTLWAARRADRFVEELWRAAQADPAYRGRTTLIVTVDHGRGTGGREAWRSHGAGSCASSSQVAATSLVALGLDWRAFDPSAAPPLQDPGPAAKK